MFVEIVLAVLVLFLLRHLLKEKKNYPPGPWGLPIIGNIIPMYDEDARKLCKKYGDIFTLKFGSQRFLYLADYKLTKEAYSLLEYSDRPHWRVFATLKGDRLEDDYLGLINSNGARWQHNRRFMIRHLRDLGMGKTVLEYAILHEVEDLVKYFSKCTEEESTEIPFALNVSILNVIFQLVASHRYDFEDKKVEQFMERFNYIEKEFMGFLIPDFFPMAKYLPSFIRDRLFSEVKLKELFTHFYDDMRVFIKDHEETLDPGSPRDLLDDYLIAMKEKEGSEDSFFEEYDLLRCMFDLFVAGHDTTATMIKWILLYMAEHSSVQKRVQEDIDKVVPRDTLPNLDHRSSLPIVDAVINEVSRKASFLSFGVQRWTTSDTTLKGYHIPKGTVVSNLAVICHEDPKYWEDPEEFNPDRFIGKDGGVHSSPDGFLPFGIGRRQCIGEAMARMELYLFISAILQNYTIEPPPGERVDLRPNRLPMTNAPRKQKITIKHRK